MNYVFDGFSFDVRREGESVDILVKLRIDQFGDGFCRELRYDVGRLWCWVIDDCLDEIECKLSPILNDYEDKIFEKARAAWAEVEREYFQSESINDDEGDVEVSYNERKISRSPKVRAKIIKEVVEEDASYES